MFKNNYSIIITLFLISILTASSVVLVYIYTKSRIVFQKENHQKIILNTLLPKTFSDMKVSYCFINNELLGDNKNHKFWMVTKNNKLYALIFEVIAPDGYSGNIKMIVSLDLNSKILGVRTLDHHETPGLGDKIDTHISNWITKFSGMTVLGLDDVNFSLKKYGGNIDQFTGATITPLAVVNAIKRTASLSKKLILKNFKFKNCDCDYE
ncbi:MAG: electron transport complex subunit RsxG [Buchnera aphidicola (Floraphis choui)]